MSSSQRYLLDTQAWLWFLSGDERLTKKACAAISDGGADCYVSMASYWEIHIKITIGKLKLIDNWRKKFENDMADNRLYWLAIERTHIDVSSTLPWHHRDPFDRLIIAQAQSEKLQVVSADKQFSAYDITVVW